MTIIPRIESPRRFFISLGYRLLFYFLSLSLPRRRNNCCREGRARLSSSALKLHSCTYNKARSFFWPWHLKADTRECTGTLKSFCSAQSRSAFSDARGSQLFPAFMFSPQPRVFCFSALIIFVANVTRVFDVSVIKGWRDSFAALSLFYIFIFETGLTWWIAGNVHELVRR